MDVAACQNNLTECLTSMGLKLCDANKDICLERGLCVTSIIPTSVSVCICYPCYYVSLAYIWQWSLVSIGLERMLVECYNYSIFDSRKRSFIISTLIFIICPLTTIPGIFTLKKPPTDQFYSQINGLLALVSCVNYTPTGYTIYKVIFSIHLYGTLLSYILLCLGVFVHLLRHRQRIAPNYTTLQNIRLILRNHRDFFIPLSVRYIWGWSIVSIALERMLVECYNYSIFDSRKRSFIISTLIFIICPLTTIPGIFTVKKLPTDKFYSKFNKLLTPVACVNYTPIGYIIYKVIFSIHFYGTLLSYILLCLGVFVHLLRHRQLIAPNYTTLQNIRLILRNHRYFFIPLSVSLFCSMPMLVIFEIMTCSKVSKLESLPYLTLVFGNVFGLLPQSFTFFYYIYPANVYMVAFWNDSPIGRCLRKLKKNIIKIGQQLKTTPLMSIRLPQLLHRETVIVEHEVTETKL
ncbi:unnamed protein product [Rotaria sordida]|uniref:Uncharacterized protein n=1 Tax=Rotaria sordida TaxID=392033 RepID=A0A814GJU4_9BILA|nr:unnamed protein product [Rotaria sordida]